MSNTPPAISAEPTPPLELHNISKRFSNLQALSRVSLTLRPGTVHALLGENGAGKTTLMRIAFGMISPDEGQITIASKTTRLRSPADAIKAGIGMVHQHFMLVPAMSVAENLELGKRGRYDARRAAERVRKIGSQTGLELNPDSQVSSLNVSAQQRLEILRALARDAKVLILDEPTAVLAPAESQELLRVMRRLVDGGTSVVLITHKLRDALRYSDDVSVLRRGHLVMSDATSRVTEESLADAMLGQESHQSSPPSHSVTVPAVDTPIIQLKNASIDSALSGRPLTGVNLEIKRGEIIGIASLDGAAADLLRVLARRANALTGSVTLPPDVGFIPEDRHRDAMISEFRLFENVALRDSGFRRGRLAWAAFRARTNSILNRFDVRAQSIEMHAGALSGGNQQKLVLGRELDDDPDVLVAENPTRGLDILATENIKQHLRAAADHGCAIIFYSSDIEEIVELANRAFVVRDGALIPVERSEEAIGYALLRS